MSSKAPHRALALTTRIVLGYTLAAAIVLSASAVFLYRGLAHGFVLEDTELLSDQVEQVRGLMLRQESGLEDARRFILAAAGVRELEKYYGRLLDERGELVVETPGMERVAPTAAGFPAPIREPKPLREVAFWHGPQERLSLLASAEVKVPGHSRPWTFQIALDAEHVFEWLDEYRERLYWMVGGGTFVTALLGWFITWRGLQPLRQITATVKDVTSHDIRGGFDARRWPAELAVLAEEFEHMLSRLRDSFARLTQFSADVAHELRTPLNNLMGATTLTLSRPRSAGEYRGALEDNLEQFERLRNMVESLLFIARAENADEVANRKPCDAGEICREVCDFFSALAEDLGISLSCDGEGTVSADDVLLRLAVTNLISNALRHTTQNGKVSVLVQAGEEGCEIAVSDSGSGIASEHHERLFERFYRVEAAREDSESGAGLGLAIVKSVMKLHRGTVTLESNPGRGSIFRLRFPAQR